jgi:hypothetical protein
MKSIKNLNELLTKNTTKMVFSKSNIGYFLNIIENDGNGDCLFRSFSELKYGNETNHVKMRKKVCDYYKNFKRKVFKTSFEKELQIVPDGEENHGEAVCGERVWGDEVDIVIFAIINDCNIVLFSDDKGGYNVKVYKPRKNNKVTHYLYYSGNNHYRAMIPKEKENTPLNFFNRITRKYLKNNAKARTTRKVNESLFERARAKNVALDKENEIFNRKFSIDARERKRVKSLNRKDGRMVERDLVKRALVNNFVLNKENEMFDRKFSNDARERKRVGRDLVKRALVNNFVLNKENEMFDRKFSNDARERNKVRQEVSDRNYASKLQKIDNNENERIQKQIQDDEQYAKQIVGGSSKYRNKYNNKTSKRRHK